MTTSKDLMLAILAMDSYNRGYGEGLAGLGGLGSKIGEATLSTDSSQALGLNKTKDAGFYAAAYTWDNKTVISYRENYGGSAFISPKNPNTASLYPASPTAFM